MSSLATLSAAAPTPLTAAAASAAPTSGGFAALLALIPAAAATDGGAGAPAAPTGLNGGARAAAPDGPAAGPPLVQVDGAPVVFVVPAAAVAVKAPASPTAWTTVAATVEASPPHAPDPPQGAANAPTGRIGLQLTASPKLAVAHGPARDLRKIDDDAPDPPSISPVSVSPAACPVSAATPGQAFLPVLPAAAVASAASADDNKSDETAPPAGASPAAVAIAVVAPRQTHPPVRIPTTAMEAASAVQPSSPAAKAITAATIAPAESAAGPTAVSATAEASPPPGPGQAPPPKPAATDGRVSAATGAVSLTGRAVTPPPPPPTEPLAAVATAAAPASPALSSAKAPAGRIGSIPVRAGGTSPHSGSTATLAEAAAEPPAVQPRPGEAIFTATGQGGSAEPGDGGADRDPASAATPGADGDLAAPAPPPQDPTLPATPIAAGPAGVGPAAAPAASRATVPGLAAEIVRQAGRKASRFDVTLDPDGLGRVDVRLQIAADGRLSARLTFDRPDAAAALGARAGELRQALSQAGFDVQPQALTFETGAGAFGGGAGFQHFGGGDDTQGGARGGARAFAAAASPDADAPAPSAPSQAAAGLDIRI